MRRRILNGLQQEAQVLGVHGDIKPSGPGLPHMTSGWGPLPDGHQITKDWFGQSAFMEVPLRTAIHRSLPGF